MAQKVRRYGANITLDLHLPLFAGAATALGRPVDVSPVGGFVGAVLGGRVAPIATYHARFGLADHLRQVSGGIAILPLAGLDAADLLQARCAELDAGVAQGALPRAKAWEGVQTEAAAQGWLRPARPLHDPDPDLPLWDALAEAMDFVVNGLIVRVGTPALSEGREWYLPPELERVATQCVAMGWTPEAATRAIGGLTDRIKLWTVTVG
jgi:hypothetical protein